MTEVERTALYRLYDETSQLIYVGISNDPERRCQAHATRQSWGPLIASKNVEWFENRSAADAAEVAAITREKPLHNRRRTPENYGAYQRVADDLKSEIHQGSLTPGSRLPTEHALVERFKTTRATIRKGIAVLRAEGLVTTRQGSGAYVTDRLDRTVAIPTARPAAAAEIIRESLSPDDLAALIRFINSPT